MLKILRRLVVCANDFKNELLMTRILLNITNIFMFSIMQLLKKFIKKHYDDSLSKYFKTQKILNLIQ